MRVEPALKSSEKDVTATPEAASLPTGEAAKGTKRRRIRWRRFLAFIVILSAFIGGARLILPWAVRDYVNSTLDRNPLYQGQIGPIEIHLWRGAYSIDDVRLLKTTGNVPVPLFAAKRVEFSIQWKALLRGRKVVGQVTMVEPELNFVDAASDGEAQTGAGGPWLQLIQDLFPFKINSAEVKNGSVHFRSFQTKEPVDVYLSQFEASVDNLTNIRDETTPMITTVNATAMAMESAKFEYKMALNPFSYRPTFHSAVRLMGVDVTKLNDLAKAYGSFDFEKGWFDLVIEMDAKEGEVTGYIKPLFRNLKVFALVKDAKQDNPIEYFWEAVLGVATGVLKNHGRDQFGTVIPFRASADGTTSTDILATIGNVLRNGFIRAYLPRLQSGAMEIQGMEFEPPSLTDPISAGDAPGGT